MSAKTKILIDGNCIVCDAEGAHYKLLAPDLFEIVDITAPDFDAARFNLTSEAVNKHMHLITPEGMVLKGVDAFAHIWSLLPRYRLVRKIILLPGVNFLARVGYEVFARVVRPVLPKKKV